MVEILKLIQITKNPLLGFLYYGGIALLIYLAIYKIILPMVLKDPAIPIKKNSKLTPRDREAIGIMKYILIAIAVTLGPYYLITNNIEAPPIKEELISCEFDKNGQDKLTERKVKMNYTTAIKMAKDSDCSLYGKLNTKENFCNSERGEWWIDIDEINPTNGCKRSCVVDVYENTVTVNRQCGV